jgi:hypothetical protein
MRRKRRALGRSPDADCRIGGADLVFRTANHALWRTQGGRYVAVDCKSGWTDNLIRYGRGHIGWDAPERFPMTFRKRTTRVVGR